MQKSSYYSEAIELQSSYEPHLHLGDIYAEEKKWHQARHHYEEVIRYWPESISTLKKLEKVLKQIASDRSETEDARRYARERKELVRQKRQELEARI